MFCCFIKKSNSNIMNTPEEVFKDSCWSNCQPFQPDLKIGKVIKVYDGDSITIAAKPYENYPIYRFSIRLSGIDTPELRTRNENEKKHAIIARDALSEKILDKIVTLKNVESENMVVFLLTFIWEMKIYVNGWLLIIMVCSMEERRK